MNIMTETESRDGLPFNLDALIHARSIESNRLEFKATWSPPIKAAVICSVCAFANDLHNLNGGYIIIGIEENEGRPVLPPRGLEGLNLDLIQKEIRGACNRIHPQYQPVLFPAVFQGKSILVIYAPGGDTRPYKAPENVNEKGSRKAFYVRLGCETVEAKDELFLQLMEVSAKVPFDDRRHYGARTEDLSPTLVRRFLREIRSALVEDGNQVEDLQLYRKLRIVGEDHTQSIPKNVGLLFFNEDPSQWFPGARIEVVQFGDDAGGDLIEERVFRGPLNEQIKSALEYLNSLGGTIVQKIPGQAEAERTAPFPYEAMEEAIVNAVYHRGYDGEPEPAKIYLYPDRMEIISYPGPVPGVLREHFQPGRLVPPVPARNRRIGDFLKELRLAEGRGTGIPKIQRKMRENGLPAASFDFDDARTYFRVVLPVHPRFQILHALREGAHLWATGDKERAISRLTSAFERQPNSLALANQLVEYAVTAGNVEMANSILQQAEKQLETEEVIQLHLTMARSMMSHALMREAREILRSMPMPTSVEDTLAAAIILRRIGDVSYGEKLLTNARRFSPQDPSLLHELARTKLLRARRMAMVDGKPSQELPPSKELLEEAIQALRQALDITTDSERRAWLWYDLARCFQQLDGPIEAVEHAFHNAMNSYPQELFVRRYREWKSRLLVQSPEDDSTT